MMVSTTNRFEQLVSDLATPSLLSDNPFRVLDLPTDASGRDLRRQGDRIRIGIRLEGGEAGEAEAALRRLRDPFQRLADELLWRWPDTTKGAEGHNEAIRLLEVFLDTDRDSSEPERCRQAVQALARNLRARATAEYVAERVKALDDSRLTPADGTRLLAEAERLVPLLALRRAVRLHEAGDKHAAVALAAAARTARRGPAREAASEAVAPVVTRVRSTARAAAAEARDEVALGAACARRLLDQAAGDVRLVRDLHDEDDPVRLGLVDEVAQRVLECVIPFYNETRDHEAALSVLRAARDLGPGPTLRTRLDEGIAALTADQELLRCWFCEAEEADPDTPFEVEMYGEVERVYLRVTWKTAKVPIPRGPRCRRAHARNRWLDQLGWDFVLAAFVSLIVPFVSDVGWGGVVVAMAVMLVVAFALLGTDGLRWKATTDRALAHPLVVGQQARGWSLGTRPPGVQ